MEARILPKIIFTTGQGLIFEVEGDVGSSVMNVARMNNIPGIEAECGGALSCGTCHVYINPEDISKLDVPTEDEEEMLQYVESERRRGSRLSCQIMIKDSFEELSIEVPLRQS